MDSFKEFVKTEELDESAIIVAPFVMFLAAFILLHIIRSLIGFLPNATVWIIKQGGKAVWWVAKRIVMAVINMVSQSVSSKEVSPEVSIRIRNLEKQADPEIAPYVQAMFNCSKKAAQQMSAGSEPNVNEMIDCISDVVESIYKLEKEQRQQIIEKLKKFSYSGQRILNLVS